MGHSILPSIRIDRVTFVENHTATWQTEATAIGTSTSAVTALTTKAVTARAAYNAHILAQAQAKAATQVFYDAVAAMTTDATAIIRQVKAKAALSGNSIYTLALLPIPATPTPVPPPGTPTDFRVALQSDGSLQLKWKCPNPAGSGGTTYQVSRKTGTTGDFIMLTTVGARSFTDPTIPAGTPSVTYRVQAFARPRSARRRSSSSTSASPRGRGR
ncbi:MAG: hypothetical protein JWN40_3345 [Phycisphaerales bacterium]|nr:hypothetical protein [Phycisphaerales bacterium]